MTERLDDAVGLLHIAIDYIDEENWDDAWGCLDEALTFVSRALTECEKKLDEEEE